MNYLFFSGRKKRRWASQQSIKSTSELLSGSDKLSRGLWIDKTISFYYRELGSIKDSEILAKVIFLLNGPLSHTLLISYYISSSHLHKKRTFPCASLLIFYFFFSLTTSYLSWLSTLSYFLRLLCFRGFIRINPVPRTASVPNPIIPYFQPPSEPVIGNLNTAVFVTSYLQS